MVLTKTHKISLNLLSITVFMLLAVPRMNIRIGPVPFYFIDALLLATYLMSIKLPSTKGVIKMNGAFIAIILFFAVISELYAMSEMLNIVEPLYLIIRTLLAGSLFYSTIKIIDDHDKLVYVVKYAAVGLVITSTLLMLTSLPPTRTFANNYLLSIRLFEPSTESVLEMYSQYSGAMRGRSYVGVSILSGAFLNSMWPVILFLSLSNRVQGYWKVFIFIVSIVVPIAVIMTYSRGAIIGLAVVVLGTLMLNVGNYRNKLILASTMLIFGFLYVGIDSNYFYFSRLEKSTERAIRTHGENRNEAERINAYTEPFEHLMDNPQFALFGKGLSFRKSNSDFGFKKNYADHAVFAKAYYSYGLIAAIFYVIIVLYGVSYSFRRIIESKNSKSIRFSKIVFVMLLGFIPWFTLGHAAVSTPRGAMFAFFVFGLISIQKRINYTDLLDQNNQWKEQ